MNRILKYILISGIAIFVVSCSSTRHLPFASYSLEPLTKKGLVQKVVETENAEDYTQIARFTADYLGVQEQSSFKGFARIAQDSLMMLSLSPGIGGEAMRILLSPDSSKTLNRIESTYSEASYEDVDQMIPLPFELFQSLLNYHFTDFITDDFSLSIQDKMYALENKKDKQHYTSIAVDGRYMVRKLYYKDFLRNTSVNVVYNTFMEVEGKLFPQDIEVTINSKRESVILRLSVKRVEFKDELSFPFKVSSRYVKI